MGQKVNISKFYSLSVEHCTYIYNVSNAGRKQTQCQRNQCLFPREGIYVCPLCPLQLTNIHRVGKSGDLNDLIIDHFSGCRIAQSLFTALVATNFPLRKAEVFPASYASELISCFIIEYVPQLFPFSFRSVVVARVSVY